ncbi:uncharacterized protein LOC105163771 [Sesamum indicum]|uniref:Uncharacterized protein LOC105163771 n=1 Tax=Sesamum indicum TaxID=4182 RepID=A0A6I9TAI4_SESIN|nr:uncharacterized protein LOC105163771 [Sesamum indicum]
MASLQVGATPVEDVIIEAEATPQLVAQPPPPPPEPVKSTVDVEEEEEEGGGVDELTAPPYEGEVENWDDEEEKDDIEYSPLTEREGGAFRSAAGQPGATFGDFNEDEEEEDEHAP